MIVDRYLAKNIITSTLLVLLLLVGLAVFITLIKEVGDIGNGDFRFLSAIEYVVLDLPQQLYNFFPIASLLGVLLGLGWLASNNELTVLRASGMSIGRIGWGVLKGALLLLIIITILGEGVAPMAEHAAESRKALLTSSGQTLKTDQGVWIRDRQSFLYIRSAISDKQLQGISRYQFDNNQKLVSISYANSGNYQQGQWVMKNIVKSLINPTLVQTQQLAQEIWPLSINPTVLRISRIEPEEMSLKQLNNYLNYLQANNLNTGNYALAFWQRIVQPLATLVMIWLAIPFVFGPLRSATMGMRTILGGLLGFAFYTLNQFFGPLSLVYQVPPFIAALLPVLLFAIAAYSLQRKIS